MTGSGISPMASRRRRLRRLLAPLVRRVIPSRLPMRGPYNSYGAALADATGYDSPVVATQVEAATRAVLEGRAVYERDGTTFSERPDLAIHRVLRQVVSPNATIADFGGGLGGLFISTQDHVPPGCRLLVIEQASMVEAGRRLAREHRLPLEFVDSREQALPPIDVLILSGVLQYLPDPWATLESLLLQTSPAIVILDRTTIRRGGSRWYLQTNPGYYTEAVTYPVQVLDRRRLLNSFSGYRLEQSWHNSFDAGRPEHIGMLLLREPAPVVASGGRQ